MWAGVQDTEMELSRLPFHEGRGCGQLCAVLRIWSNRAGSEVLYAADTVQDEVVAGGDGWVE